MTWFKRAKRKLHDWRKDELVPHAISTETPCPACGNRGCDLQYDPATQKVKRTCKTCGCVVQQPPVYPSLFTQQK